MIARMHAMSARRKLLALAIIVSGLFGLSAHADPAAEIVGPELLREALVARTEAAGAISNTNYLSIIDYRAPSRVPRFYLVDMRDMSATAHLVAHGKGSDLDHDGMADQFSNIEGSKMTSLGAFTTGATYYGAHGLSLKLNGLGPDNDQARQRRIVIHGADYVSPSRQILGRSWGCPALENGAAQMIIPLIKGGSFLYVVGVSSDAG